MGRLFGFGREPVRMAGTAPTVSQKTVDALRYQVASRASAAKFGNRPASIRPLRFIRVVVLSSSKTTTTTGVLEPTVAACTSGVWTKTSFVTGESKRKSPRKRSGAAARTERNEPTTRTRQ